MGALVTSNCAKKLFGARRPTFRKNGYVPEKTAIYKSTDTIQIKMGALVNQSHAKKLFGARLVDKNYAKSYSELGNIFQYDSNENGCTSNF